MLPSVQRTAMADVTLDFLLDVTYGTVKRLEMAASYALTGIVLYDTIH
jgi:hypothetical protein